MKRPALVFLAAGVAAVLAYFLCYHFATRDTRQMMAADSGDGIAWLRQEFSLNDEQTRAVAALQEEYEPHCMEMCARISAVNRRIEQLLPAASTMTPELRGAGGSKPGAGGVSSGDAGAGDGDQRTHGPGAGGALSGDDCRAGFARCAPARLGDASLKHGCFR